MLLSYLDLVSYADYKQRLHVIVSAAEYTVVIKLVKTNLILIRLVKLLLAILFDFQRTFCLFIAF